MCIRDSVATVISRRKDKDGLEREYRSHLVRRTFREDGKVKHQTLANISALPAGNNCSPRRLARIASIAPAGNALILANVWCLTLPSSRKVRRTRCDRYSRSRPSLSFRRLITVATCIASEDLPMSTNIRPTRQYRHTTRLSLIHISE